MKKLVTLLLALVLLLTMDGSSRPGRGHVYHYHQ